MSWPAQTGCSYFVEGSRDLSGWRYFDSLGQGDPAGYRLAFASPAARYFVRLRTMLELTWPADDPDGDRLSTASQPSTPNRPAAGTARRSSACSGHKTTRSSSA